MRERKENSWQVWNIFCCCRCNRVCWKSRSEKKIVFLLISIFHYCITLAVKFCVLSKKNSYRSEPRKNVIRRIERCGIFFSTHRGRLKDSENFLKPAFWLRVFWQYLSENVVNKLDLWKSFTVCHSNRTRIVLDNMARSYVIKSRHCEIFV